MFFPETKLKGIEKIQFLQISIQPPVHHFFKNFAEDREELYRSIVGWISGGSFPVNLNYFGIFQSIRINA